MKRGVRSPAFRRKGVHVIQSVFGIAFRLKAGLRAYFPQESFLLLATPLNIEDVEQTKVRFTSSEESMKRLRPFFLMVCSILMACIVANAQNVKITENKEKKQLDVTVDSQPFTSYVYWDDQKKPILYPLRTAKGTIVTRGFPLERVAGERTDHPHHISS